MEIDIERLLKRNAVAVDKAIEKYIPRRFERNSLVFSLSPPRFDYNLEALNKAVTEPIWDFLSRGGKRWRPTLFLLIVEALGGHPDEFLEFAIIPEVVHNGTIMIDDIEDDSPVRRGKSSAHKIFGTDIAINAGNSMYYLPLMPLMKNRNKLSPERLSRIYEIYAQEMINLSLGQAMDIVWHRGLSNADNINEKQYMQMCAYKTGTLARMAAKIAAVLCKTSEEKVERLGKFAEAAGIAFQIQDDILDLTDLGFAKEKGGKGQDITEGKRSLIVIHALHRAKPEDKARLLAILKMHTRDQALKNEAIQILEKCNSIDYVKEVSKNLMRESWQDIDRLLDPSEAKKKLKAFAFYLVERKK